jgi:hypothetical protein
MLSSRTLLGGSILEQATVTVPPAIVRSKISSYIVGLWADIINDTDWVCLDTIETVK